LALGSFTIAGCAMVIPAKKTVTNRENKNFMAMILNDT
jgi:hypothetical protein